MGFLFSLGNYLADYGSSLKAIFVRINEILDRFITRWQTTPIKTPAGELPVNALSGIETLSVDGGISSY
jgi:hypothetical protein